MLLTTTSRTCCRISWYLAAVTSCDSNANKSTGFNYLQRVELASCLIYARALIEYVIIIVWLRSVNKMLPSVKFAEDKVLTFLILREKC